ncbi:N-acetylglucosamine kinase [Symbioplanes lichenis]|uniref:N-acetylglucosamine kinase n=1 Tax=Symbioplanes lichenis TaxID=1629072 RepID=UPI002738B7E5|nr:BadF/BadG/BcrA/BcrD ATPase family protein [Actinoplanes lichenis]
MAELVVGADAGGTSTRVTVATTAGARLTTVAGGGANPTTHGVEAAAGELGATVRRALAGLDEQRVAAVFVGLAGRATLGDPAAARLFSAAIGVAARPVFVADTEVAFCSATPAADGTVLVAGTGAMAVDIRDRASARTSDGLGWLLGDEGSAFWLGRAAVRASIADICRTGPATTLTAAVTKHLRVKPAGRSALIRAVAARPPIALAELAPLVTTAADAGDAVAGLICDDAAGRLVRLVADVRDPAATTPIVLTGGVAGPAGSPVGRRVREQLEGEVLATSDGVAGAAWLAVRDVHPEWPETRLAEVHARLRSGVA